MNAARWRLEQRGAGTPRRGRGAGPDLQFEAYPNKREARPAPRARQTKRRPALGVAHAGCAICEQFCCPVVCTCTKGACSPSRRHIWTSGECQLALTPVRAHAGALHQGWSLGLKCTKMGATVGRTTAPAGAARHKFGPKYNYMATWH